MINKMSDNVTESEEDKTRRETITALIMSKLTPPTGLPCRWCVPCLAMLAQIISKLT